MFSFLRAVGAGLIVLLTCLSAVAEQPSDLLPPVTQSNTDVPYPQGAEGDAAVLLELVVEKDGSVSSATVVDGVEPFAEQARKAALTWRFAPARRAQQPVASRIRARVDFHPEPEDALAEPALPAVPPAAATTAEAAAKPSTPPPMEITVVGSRREIGQTTLSKSDVREMPGAFGDAFRAIEALPGVAPVVSGMPYFYVRGAPPNNAGYYVDGVRVPLLFHLGIGQSVIHPGLVDHVDFFPSAAPARYGYFAGAIIAGRTREPATTLRGEAHVRLVDAGALLEAPFASGRGTALVAGRYGYPGPIIALATDEMKIGYWDYQARTTWKPSPKSTLGLFAFGSHDYLASRSPSSDPEARDKLVEEFVSDFHRLDLRFDQAWPEGRARIALTGGYDSQGAAPSYVTNKSLGLRLEVEQRFSQQLLFRGGADAQLDAYRMRLSAQGPGEPVVPDSANPPPTNLTAGLHADVVWRVARRVELVPGARFNVFASSRPRGSPDAGRVKTLIPAIDPRLSARVTVSPGVAWLASFGLSHQYPSLRLGEIPAPVLSVPGFPFAHQQLQTAMQGSQGFEVALPADLVLAVTGFYSVFWGLTDLSAGCFQYLPGDQPEPAPNDPVPPYICPNNQPVGGKAFGLELLLRRSFSKRLSGWLSYTLARSVREAHFVKRDGTDDFATVASEFDRSHVLNAVLGYALGRGWRVGTRLLFLSGTPYSRLDGAFPVPPYNAYRNPAFYRVDFRLEKRWRLGPDGSIAFVLEGQNVTLSKEVSGLGLECDGRPMAPGETTSCKQSTVGPLTIPSIGVEAFF